MKNPDSLNWKIWAEPAALGQGRKDPKDGKECYHEALNGYNETKARKKSECT
jgi:hypothetical protein